ncbi:HPP family protein [Asticcacaulis sp. BYS171W]|uniref:HPP family protein n=1 Tax=Asticcacaulis aquaticus TaxID=2984212 RepID=A0ABT5HT15_9CAUL|nr:HPP family protein [Asticcacaulis aquaticus]MDC7682611.1 HPP family protein [Asticcacaulis aquaticus]
MTVTFSQWLDALKPKPLPVSGLERMRSALGAFIGICFTALTCLLFARQTGLSPWLVAPVGASAVLVFAVPASPLAQPWSVVGGNTVSALMGLICANLVPDPVIAASLAVSLAIAAMFATRSLHPPGGAMALLVVLTHTQNPWFALFPAFTNSLLLVAVGIAFNMVAKRNYPHIAPVPQTEDNHLRRVTPGDIAAALEQMDTVIDIAPDDLEKLLILSETHAYQRLMDHIRARDIMTPDPVHVEFGTPLEEVMDILRTHDFKLLPVTDKARRVVGVITPDDLLRQAAGTPATLRENLKQLVRRTPSPHSHKPEVAGQVMTTHFRTADHMADVATLVPLFSDKGQHHLLILDETRRLTGILSASDVMRAVYHRPAA